MNKAFIFIADGFEEVEAVTPLDYLRRSGVETILVGVTGTIVRSSRNVGLVCDYTLDSLLQDAHSGVTDAALIVLPGGLQNSRMIGENQHIKQFTEQVFQKGGLIAAICAAPALTLGQWGMLNGKRFTCYPGMGTDLPTPPVNNARVIKDGNLITACGAGAAEEFAFALVETLCGAEKCEEIKTAVVAR